ncbi:MAG: hypothetical protein ACO24O_08595 [Arenimonas sp.]
MLKPGPARTGLLFYTKDFVMTPRAFVFFISGRRRKRRRAD